MPATMFLHNWNGFEIDPSYDNILIRQGIIGERSSFSKQLFLDVLALTTFKFTPLYKGVNT